MKLIHLSDFHLGKRLNEYSLAEDQEYVLRQILTVIAEERPDAVIIAGDVYDKSVPSAEAVQLFDDFLVRLFKMDLQVFVISGNHDSPERIAFGGRLMDAGGVHMSPVYHGKVEPVPLTDEYGTVDIYMLPFLKPASVRRFYPDEEIGSYTDAIGCAVAHMPLDPTHRNVLVTHQFVTGASRSDSEEITVGGTDNVDASVFAPFDYVALGHIHSPQNCGTETVRYSGTPLKYSFSEARDEKSVTVVCLGAKGETAIRTVPLKPQHDMVELRGTYEELTRRSFYENTTWQEDYTHLTLTDEEDIPDAIGKLRAVYHRLMKLDYDNTRTRTQGDLAACADVDDRSPEELFAAFYEAQNNRPMSEEQAAFMRELIEKTWEEEQ